MENERCREQLIYCYRLLAIIDNLVCIQWGDGNISNLSENSSKSVNIRYPISFSSVANVYLSNSNSYTIATRTGTSLQNFNLTLRNIGKSTVSPSYSWLAIGY